MERKSTSLYLLFYDHYESKADVKVNQEELKDLWNIRTRPILFKDCNRLQNEKTRNMRDQLLMARAYLQVTPLNSNSRV